MLASFGILIAGWQIGAAATTPVVSAGTSTSGSGGSTTTATTSGSGTTGSTGSTGSTTTTTTASSDGTYTGQSVGTRFGNVQVQVTISGGTITDVTALQLTNSDGRSVQISNYAAPLLQKEVLTSQSANVSNVGGATYTSQAYLSSLQSALDQAGF
ncbi:hypothetical protein BH11ACT3_BH11ACT3_21360 [soil metagenome]